MKQKSDDIPTAVDVHTSTEFITGMPKLNKLNFEI